MNVADIRQEINEVGEVALGINQRLGVAKSTLSLDSLSAKTNIEIAINICDRIRSRLIAIQEGMS